MGIFQEVTQRVTQTTTSGLQQLNGTVAGFSAMGAGTSILRSAVGNLNASAANTVDKVLRGDLTGAALSLAGKTLGELLTSGEAGNALFNGLRNPLLGGITPAEAAQIITEMATTNYAKKNLYFIEITDYASPLDDQNSSGLFNMFCTSVSIGGGSLIGEQHNIGSGAMDAVTGCDRGDFRVTTYDDTYGQIKRWFNKRKDLAAHPDGTFGLPTDYLLKLRVLHAAVNDEVMALFGGYEDWYIVRPVGIEADLARAEDGLQELQLSFVQFDTYMFNQGY